MQANNLTISIPYKGCDKNCPYCVSRMTGYMETNESLMKHNLPKVKKLSEIAGVTSVLITGKGEPLLNMKWIKTISEYFTTFPLELQTNGLFIKKDFDRSQGAVIQNLYKLGINTIAFSLDKISQINNYSELFSTIKDYGINVRITFNISDLDDTCKNLSFDRFIELCSNNHISQVSFRKLTIPVNIMQTDESLRTAEWIKQHSNDQLYNKWAKELRNAGPRIIRELPFGAKVFDWKGISISHFDYCIQEFNKNDDIRSLIFLEDGHLYTSWDSEASILF